jgi:hypothetical protein
MTAPQRPRPWKHAVHRPFSDTRVGSFTTIGLGWMLSQRWIDRTVRDAAVIELIVRGELVTVGRSAPAEGASAWPDDRASESAAADAAVQAVSESAPARLPHPVVLVSPERVAASASWPGRMSTAIPFQPIGGGVLAVQLLVELVFVLGICAISSTLG